VLLRKKMEKQNNKSRLPLALFDIGGTNTRVAISFDGQTIEGAEMVKTPKNFSEGIELVSNLIKSKLNGGSPAHAVGGIAGPLTRDKSGIVNAENLINWCGYDLKLELGSKIGSEVVLENDASLVGLGEAVYGAGKNEKIVAYITLSTGVNGVRVVNGEIEESVEGFEIGRQVINMGDNRYQTLEQLVSGAALQRRYGKPAYELDDPSVWDEVAHIAAIGVFNTVLYWSPSIVVIGGSLVKRISIEKLKLTLKSLSKLSVDMPTIVKAELGDLGGLWGALHRAK
jgi:predicted NBD/HSP70 family sugar kinase